MNAIGKTDIGKSRNANEDAFFCSSKKIGKLPNLYIVADGMGGHKAGEYASSHAVSEFIKYVKNNKTHSAETIFIEGINYINALLFKKSMENEAYFGMGTTFVVCSIMDDKVTIANVGDSRLYLINDTIKQITKDHSLVEEMISNGEITRGEERSHPKKNIITRAVGVSNDIDVDVFTVHKQQEDSLLLCSDGLTNMLEDDKILEVVTENTSIEKIVDELIDKALENGGHDNITTVVIQ